jgi:hypothetical protein
MPLLGFMIAFDTIFLSSINHEQAKVGQKKPSEKNW